MIHRVNITYGKNAYSVVTEQFDEKNPKVISCGNSSQQQRFTKNVVRKLTKSYDYSLRTVGKNLEFISAGQ